MNVLRLSLILCTSLCSPICVGQQFYECKIPGSAPIYQDFPCEQGKERGIGVGSVSDVEKDRSAVEGLIKHGYRERAHKYAMGHGMSEEQFRAIADRTDRETQASYNRTQREVAVRRAQAAREQALKEEAQLQAAYSAMMYQPSYDPGPLPASRQDTPVEVIDTARPAWAPSPPVYDPEGNRWCQNTSPSTVHCW